MAIGLTVVVPAEQKEAVRGLPKSLIDESHDAERMNREGLWLGTLDQLNEALESAPPQATRILVDGAAFKHQMPRFLVALSALLADWKGSELSLVLPPGEEPCHLLRPLADLLRALEQRAKGIRLISCPTCARCHTNLIPLARRLGKELERIDAALEVAIMGCEVNGPGEAKAADLGVAFGRGVALLFRQGRIIKRVAEEEAEAALLEEVQRRACNRHQSG